MSKIIFSVWVVNSLVSFVDVSGRRRTGSDTESQEVDATRIEEIAIDIKPESNCVNEDDTTNKIGNSNRSSVQKFLPTLRRFRKTNEQVQPIEDDGDQDVKSLILDRCGLCDRLDMLSVRDLARLAGTSSYYSDANGAVGREIERRRENKHMTTEDPINRARKKREIERERARRRERKTLWACIKLFGGVALFVSGLCRGMQAVMPQHTHDERPMPTCEETCGCTAMLDFAALTDDPNGSGRLVGVHELLSREDKHFVFDVYKAHQACENYKACQDFADEEFRKPCAIDGLWNGKYYMWDGMWNGRYFMQDGRYKEVENVRKVGDPRANP